MAGRELAQPIWIAVEGPDGGGKSTAARALAHVLACADSPTVVQKTSYYTQEDLYLLPPARWLDEGLCVVQDRTFLSELVYAGVVGREAKWSRERHLEMCARAAGLGMMVFYFTAELAMLEARVAERGDDYVHAGQIKQIALDYEMTLQDWEKAGGLVYTFDTTRGFPGDLELQLATSLLLSVRATRAGG